MGALRPEVVKGGMGARQRDEELVTVWLQDLAVSFVFYEMNVFFVDLGRTFNSGVA